eukprot:2152328-Rhodomonas_salina.1
MSNQFSTRNLYGHFAACGVGQLSSSLANKAESVNFTHNVLKLPCEIVHHHAPAAAFSLSRQAAVVKWTDLRRIFDQDLNHNIMRIIPTSEPSSVFFWVALLCTLTSSTWVNQWGHGPGSQALVRGCERLPRLPTFLALKLRGGAKYSSESVEDEGMTSGDGSNEDKRDPKLGNWKDAYQRAFGDGAQDKLREAARGELPFDEIFSGDEDGEKDPDDQGWTITLPSEDPLPRVSF